jgi:hypothetical protein
MFYGNISSFSSGIFHFEKVTSSFFANFNRSLTWRIRPLVKGIIRRVDASRVFQKQQES